MEATIEQLRVARVLAEDGDFITLEIAKSDDRELQISEGDQFYTVLFVHNPDKDSTLVPWLPWEGS